MFHNSISLNISSWIGENSKSTKQTNILTRTSTSNYKLQMLSYKTPASVSAFNWNCCSMFFAISRPRSKSCLMESIQRVTEINHHILNEPSAMERIYIFLFKDNTKTNKNTLTMKTYTISWVSVSWLNAFGFSSGYWCDVTHTSIYSTFLWE